jgi:hypothetical protein
MKDFLGQDITVGRTVVYPGRQGSRMWMNRATVTELLPNGIKVERIDGGLRVLKCLNRVVVIHAIEEPDRAEI